VRAGRSFRGFSKFSAMANTKSALKYVRKTESRSLRNRRAKSRLKTLARKVDSAVVSGDAETLASASRNYVSALDKAAKSGLVHRNKVAREKARCASLARG
jgi:small subunit ribosomal protein S20